MLKKVGTTITFRANPWAAEEAATCNDKLDQLR
jgi:hypothetical protein